ncbi:MAG: Mut7-C RNAse domain-containing protein [Syntrophobacteraceae bacterium]
MSRAGTPGKRFAVDIMLGKLAKWLRALGFDARSMPLDERVRIDSLVSEGYIPVTRREKFRHIEGEFSFETIISSSSSKNCCPRWM